MLPLQQTRFHHTNNMQCRHQHHLNCRVAPTAPRQHPQQHQQHPQQHWRQTHCIGNNRPAFAVRSLPRIADFIRDECPIRGLDGTFREQAAGPGAQLQDSCVVQMHEEALLVPGQRQLVYVHEQQLERIITDQGTAVLACLQTDSGAAAAAAAAGGGGAAAAPKLLSPARGSWAVSAAVGGVQRLPGSSRALVRLLVTDRVAVQALSSTSPNLVLARSAQLRDRWCYFVRTAALEQHLNDSSSSNGGSPGNNGAGRDVLNAVQQVQDAATELLQLLKQLTSTVQQVVDAPEEPTAAAAAGEGVPSAAAGLEGSSGSSSLQQQLQQHEAAEELAELLCRCEMSQDSVVSTSSSDNGTADNPSSSNSNGALLPLLPADSLLMERAWRLSFAPFAARGLAAAVGIDVEAGKSSSVSTSSSEVLEMMDLGLRLEAAWELGQALRQKLAARLSLEKLNQA